MFEYRSMNRLLIFAIIMMLQSEVQAVGHIYGWDPEVSYGSTGQLNKISLFFKLESGLPKMNFVHINLPFQIGSKPNVSLSSYDQLIVVNQRAKNLVHTHQTGDYYMQFDYDIIRDVWYTLELMVTTREDNGPIEVKAGSYGPVKMRTTSYFPRFYGSQRDEPDLDLIVYDENNVLATIEVLPVPVTTVDDLTINVGFVSGSNNNYNNALLGDNRLLFTIQPGPKALGSFLPGTVNQKAWLDVLARNNNIKNISDKSLLSSQVLKKTLYPDVYFYVELIGGFQFQDVQSDCTLEQPATVYSQFSCMAEKDEDLGIYNRIRLVGPFGEVAAVLLEQSGPGSNPQFQFQIKFQNPLKVVPFVFAVYSQYARSGKAVGQILARRSSLQLSNPNIFSTQPIRIVPDSFKVQIHWGFPLNNSVEYNSSVSSNHNHPALSFLYVTDVGNAATPSYSSPIFNKVQFNFSFSSSLSQISSINVPLRIRVRVQCSSMIDSLIATNLPQYSSSRPLLCRGEILPEEERYEIVCQPVGRLEAGFVYYVQTRVFYRKGHGFDTKQTKGFGRVTVEMIDEQNSNALYAQSSAYRIYNAEENSGIDLKSDYFKLAINTNNQQRSAVWGTAGSVLAAKEEEPGGTATLSDLFADRRRFTGIPVLPISSTATLQRQQQFAVLLLLQAKMQDMCINKTTQLPCSNNSDSLQQIETNILYNNEYLTAVNSTRPVQFAQVNFNNAGGGIPQISIGTGADYVPCLKAGQCTETAQSDYNSGSAKVFSSNNGFGQYAQITLRCGGNASSPNGADYSRNQIEQCNFYNESFSDGLYHIQTAVQINAGNTITIKEGTIGNVIFAQSSMFSNGKIINGQNFVNGYFVTNNVGNASQIAAQFSRSSFNNFQFVKGNFTNAVLYDVTVSNSDVDIVFANGSAQVINTGVNDFFSIVNCTRCYFSNALFAQGSFQSALFDGDLTFSSGNFDSFSFEVDPLTIVQKNSTLQADSGQFQSATIQRGVIQNGTIQSGYLVQGSISNISNGTILEDLTSQRFMNNLYVLALRQMAIVQNTFFSSTAGLYIRDGLVDFMVAFKNGVIDQSNCGVSCVPADTAMQGALLLHSYLISKNPINATAASGFSFYSFMNYQRGNLAKGEPPTVYRIRGFIKWQNLQTSSSGSQPTAPSAYFDQIGVFFDSAIKLAFLQDFAESSEPLDENASTQQLLSREPQQDLAVKKSILFRKSNKYYCQARAQEGLYEKCELALGSTDAVYAQNLQQPKAGTQSHAPFSAWPMMQGTILNDFSSAQDFDFVIPVATDTSKDPIFVTFVLFKTNSRGERVVVDAIPLQQSTVFNYAPAQPTPNLTLRRNTNCNTNRAPKLCYQFTVANNALDNLNQVIQQGLKSNQLESGLFLAVNGPNILAKSDLDVNLPSSSKQVIETFKIRSIFSDTSYMYVAFMNFTYTDSPTKKLGDLQTLLNISLTTDLLPANFVTSAIQIALSIQGGLRSLYQNLIQIESSFLAGNLGRLTVQNNQGQTNPGLYTVFPKQQTLQLKVQLDSSDVTSPLYTRQLWLDPQGKQGAKFFSIRLCFFTGSNSCNNTLIKNLIVPNFCQLSISNSAVANFLCTLSDNGTYFFSRVVYQSYTTLSGSISYNEVIAVTDILLTLRFVHELPNNLFTSILNIIKVKISIYYEQSGSSLYSSGTTAGLLGTQDIWLLDSDVLQLSSLQDLGQFSTFTAGNITTVTTENKIKESQSNFVVGFHIEKLQNGLSFFDYYGDYIKLNLAWLNNNQSQYKCLVYQDQAMTKISAIWTRMKIMRPAGGYVLLMADFPSSTQTVSSTIASFGYDKVDTYYLKCIGGKVPIYYARQDAYNKEDNVTVQWVDGNNKNILQQSPQDRWDYSSQGFKDTWQVLTTTIMKAQLLLKNMSLTGREATYKFSILSPLGLSISSNSKLYVIFEGELFPPRLNTKQGYLDCTVNEVYLAVCEILTERRLEVLVPVTISANTLFNLTISGVTQPRVPQITNSDDLISMHQQATIYIAISQSGNYGSIQFFTRLFDKMMYMSATSSATAQVQNNGGKQRLRKQAIRILASDVSSLEIRAQTNHSLLVAFKGVRSMIRAGKSLFLEFQGNAFNRLRQPTCIIQRLNDSFNWARECRFVDSRRLRIDLGASDGNASSAMILLQNQANSNNMNHSSLLYEHVYTISLINMTNLACRGSSSGQFSSPEMLIHHNIIIELGRTNKNNRVTATEPYLQFMDFAASFLDSGAIFSRVAVNSEESKQDLVWESSQITSQQSLMQQFYAQLPCNNMGGACQQYITVYQGYMKNEDLRLTQGVYCGSSSILKEPFKETFTALPSPSSILNQQLLFQFSPNQLSAAPGFYQTSAFRVGAKMQTKTGQYFIVIERQQLTATATTTASNILQIPPLLRVFVSDVLCRLGYDSITPRKVKVPRGGFSQPIKVDFQQCFPAEDVTVVAEIKNSADFDLVERQKQLVNEQKSWIDQETSVSFVVKNINIATTATMVQLSFKIRGKNGNAYDSSVLDNAVEVWLLEDTSMSAAPTITAFGLSNNYVITTKTTLSFDAKCSQEGVLYYVVFLTERGTTADFISSGGKNIDNGGGGSFNYGVNFIANVTGYGYYSKVKISGSGAGEYGSVKVTSTTQSYNITTQDLRANSQYNIECYCVNLRLMASQAAIKERIATKDNNSKTRTISVKFKSAITSYQKQFLACALCQLLPSDFSRIQTDELKTCNTYAETQLKQALSQSSSSRILDQQQDAISGAVLHRTKQGSEENQITDDAHRLQDQPLSGRIEQTNSNQMKQVYDFYTNKNDSNSSRDAVGTQSMENGGALVASASEKYKFPNAYTSDQHRRNLQQQDQQEQLLSQNVASSTVNIFFTADLMVETDILEQNLQKLSDSQFPNNLQLALPKTNYPVLEYISTSAYTVTVDDLQIPIAKIVKLQLIQNQVNLILKMDNMNGFILLGLEKASRSPLTPSVDQLKAGLNGAGQRILLGTAIEFLLQGSTSTYQIKNLEIFEEYLIFWCALNQNPSINQLNSGVFVKAFIAVPEYEMQFQKVSGDRLHFALLTMLMLFLLFHIASMYNI